MTREMFYEIDLLMVKNLNDSTHDRNHIYRVMYNALDIAKHCEADIDIDVVIAASMLHDIGRKVQTKKLGVDHSNVGGDMAQRVLIEKGWGYSRALHVSDCIESHRYIAQMKPKTLEAKIVFDADKIDMIGLMGISRTLIHCAITSEPMYATNSEGVVKAGLTDEEEDTFLKEYNKKLKKIYTCLYTERACEIAKEKEAQSEAFYNSFYEEINKLHIFGNSELEDMFGNKL